MRAIVRLTAIRSSRVSGQLLYFGPDRSPAGPGFDGTDAVHTHMTNTRLTDPEALEFRYPVLLKDFHIRLGSGGRRRALHGQWLL